MAVSFSVAMCTYNGALYVEEQLSSIATQTLLPDELVVCDDGSTDATVQIVERFAATAPFSVRLHVNERTLGSTRNFERAIKLCEGELIALADQDDVWSAEKLEQMRKVFAARTEAGLVFTDAEVVGEDLRPLGYTLWQSLNFVPHKRMMFKGGAAFEMQLTQNFVTGATMAFRSRFRDLVLPLYEEAEPRYGLPHWKLIHDGWIALLIAAVAELSPVEEPLIKYRQHSRQQLGINAPEPQEQKSPPDWRERAAETYKKYFARELKLLATIHDRLAAHRHAFDCEATIAELEARMCHLRARADLPASRLRRVPAVFTELMSLRYSRYSNGFVSAVRDLVLS
jgi:hypothetical protein